LATEMMNEVPTLPDAGLTRSGTFTVPFMVSGWIVQWYGYEPAKLIVLEKVLAATMWPEFHSESGLFCVLVWSIESLFFHVNVVPMAPDAVFGLKPAVEFTIEMLMVAARASPATVNARTVARTSAIERRMPNSPESFLGLRPRSADGWSRRVPPWRTWSPSSPATASAPR